MFIQIIGDSCLGESNSTVVEIGGCVSEEVGNWRWNTQYALYQQWNMCLLTTGQSFSMVAVKCLSLWYKHSTFDFSTYLGNSTLNSSHSHNLHMLYYGACLISEGYIRIVQMHWEIEWLAMFLYHENEYLVRITQHARSLLFGLLLSINGLDSII